MSSRSRHLIIVTAVLFAAALVWPATADAQRRGPRGRTVRPVPVRSVVYVGYGWYPGFGFYDPYWYGQWGPYGPYGYRVLPIDRRASLRIDAKPRDAQVFIDGYSAGVVDQYDGIFQRLNLEPGGHDLTLYLPGFQTVTESIYVGPGEDRRIKIDLAPLAAGEVATPPPAPHEPTLRGQAGPRRPGEPRPPRAMPPGPPPDRPAPTEPPVEARPAVAQVGTLALRVQPADAEIRIDGEAWASTPGQDRLLIQLPEGRHTLEVSKAGMQTYSQDILIQRGRTLSLNVILRER